MSEDMKVDTHQSGTDSTSGTKKPRNSILKRKNGRLGWSVHIIFNGSLSKYSSKGRDQHGNGVRIELRIEENDRAPRTPLELELAIDFSYRLGVAEKQ